MIDIDSWTHDFIEKLEEIFNQRVWFVGLQGSYSRGEATKTSDIDIVVIFDKLSVTDIKDYNLLLDTLPHREMICGFVSGKEEILNWEPTDLFQFYHDTTPIKGDIEELLPLIDSTSVDQTIKTSVCNIYHGCVHNMLHEKSEAILKDLYKSASFAIQAIAFKQTGKYYRQQKELIKVVSKDEQIIIKTFLDLKSGKVIQLNEMSENLFNWTKKWILKI